VASEIAVGGSEIVVARVKSAVTGVVLGIAAVRVAWVGTEEAAEAPSRASIAAVAQRARPARGEVQVEVLAAAEPAVGAVALGVEVAEDGEGRGDRGMRSKDDGDELKKVSGSGLSVGPEHRTLTPET
jgi:hypothetical protein